MQSLNLGGVEFSYENGQLTGKREERTVSITVTPADLERFISYVPNPDPDQPPVEIVNGIPERNGNFGKIVLWTYTRTGLVHVSFVRHKKDEEGVWVETDEIDAEAFKIWLRKLVPV